MQIPVIVSFEGLPPSEFVEQAVREQAGRLEHYFDRITSCRVVVACPHQHQHRGKRYAVRIDLTVPQDELVVNRQHALDHSDEDVYVAIRDAFHAARRQLQDYARRMRTQVKTHTAPPHGRVIKLFPEEGYGFIETADGREAYFHRNAVIHDHFGKLQVGVTVEFLEEAGVDGPNATSVRVVHPHRQRVGQRRQRARKPAREVYRDGV